jgi:nucleotide-binding universal stress UspA family protein
MKIFSNVLVPFDGSEYSTEALLQAIEITRKCQSKLYILHVKDNHIPASDAYLMEELLESRNRYSKEILEQAMKIIPVDIEANGLIKEGNPSNIIVEYAQKNNIDIIVMGSRGLGVIKGKIFGSVSQHVIQNANCCVLIAKKKL